MLVTQRVTKLCLLILCIWISSTTLAQDKDTTKRTRRTFDSSMFTDNEPTRSDYLDAFEKDFQVLNKVPIVAASFVQLNGISYHLTQGDSAIAILKGRLAGNDRTLNIRNLQMFNTLLDELDKNITDYSQYLEEYDKKMDALKKELLNLRKDTLVRHIFRDSALRNTFVPQLQQLRSKWKLADSLIKTNTTAINNLKAHSSANVIAIEELEYKVDNELKTVSSRAFGKERRYLWEPRSQIKTGASADGFKKLVSDEQKLAGYYFANTRSKRFWLLLTGIVFFYWVWFNFRSLKRMNKKDALAAFHFKYVNSIPIAASLVVILSLAPLFDSHAPAIYVESTQLLLMFTLTWLFWHNMPRNIFYLWIIFILLYLLLPLIRILGMPMSAQRWANFILNSASFVFGLFFLFRSNNSGYRHKVILFAAGIYAFFNLLAALFNLFGRVTLSEIFGTTAVYAFAQTASLAVFIQLITEAFLLQIQSSRVRNNYPEHFDATGISKSISRFTIVLAVVLWLIVFTTNLNILDALNDLLTDIMTAPRQVGDFSFTLGRAVLFLGIIWIANFLQKYIAYFFGDTGDDASIDNKGQRSRLLVTRLILLIAGFFLAVAASGLPVDRITVIIGALGVGVGLGLQNIVNNFVSGIILIFDRPLRIGDTVEIADKKGRVKEISIRSSTLLTEDGAEVIIPNGDVLSHNIVNWTLSNNHIRVALSFTIDKINNFGELQSEIREIVKANQHALPRREPEILMENINSKVIGIKVYFWCKDIQLSSLASGEVRTAIYKHLEEKGINVA